jgi:hypothetical protein
MAGHNDLISQKNANALAAGWDPMHEVSFTSISSPASQWPAFIFYVYYLGLAGH